MQIDHIVKHAKTLVTQNSPAILTGVGVAGLISTAVLTARATVKAVRLVDYEDRFGNMEYVGKKEVVKMVWKVYIPPAAVGLMSAVCIVGANTVSAKRQTALIGAYSLTETAFREYKDKIVGELGEKKEQRVRDELAQEKVSATSEGSNQVVIIGDGKVLCFEPLTGRYFESSVEIIRKAMNDINLECINNMYASQNDFYRKIGLPPVETGEITGWRADRPMELSFSTVLSENDRPCVAINYYHGPRTDYHKIW